MRQEQCHFWGLPTEKGKLNLRKHETTQTEGHSTMSDNAFQKCHEKTWKGGWRDMNTRCSDSGSDPGPGKKNYKRHWEIGKN